MAAVPPRAQVVPEAGGWSMVIQGYRTLPMVHRSSEAIIEMIEALREYAEDRRSATGPKAVVSVKRRWNENIRCSRDGRSA